MNVLASFPTWTGGRAIEGVAIGFPFAIVPDALGVLVQVSARSAEREFVGAFSAVHAARVTRILRTL